MNGGHAIIVRTPDTVPAPATRPPVWRIVALAVTITGTLTALAWWIAT